MCQARPRPAVAGEQVRDEKRGKDRFIVERRDHRRFFEAHDRALRDRDSRRDAQRLTCQASLAKKLSAPRMARIASLPCCDRTLSSILPFWM
jgi:hypothetical protein